MNVCIVGTGYVGLVSGVCLAAKGHQVTCVDLRPDVVAGLNRGEPHIHENGLPALLTEVLAAGRFRATQSLAAGLAEAEVVLLAVGTPSTDGRIDLQFIGEAAGQIGELLPKIGRFISVVVKSTVVPGTTDTFVREVLEKRSGWQLGQFGLGMNPEFLREGDAISDFMFPDRIVFGHAEPATLKRLEELYAPWDCDKLAVNPRTAEMIKYANNCLLATQISAVNELANLAAATGGIDIQDVMRGIHLDKRWNPVLSDGRRAKPGILTYLIPGCGFGGSCFPKDVQALASAGEARGSEMRLLRAVLDINDNQPQQVVSGLKRALGEMRGKSVAVLGLAFKPGTDDVRESPARKIIGALLAQAVRVIVHDPIAQDAARRAWPDLAVSYVADWESELAGVDAVVVVTAWPEYGRLTAPDNLPKLRGKCVFDCRRMLQPDDLAGVKYLAIGREV